MKKNRTLLIISSLVLVLLFSACSGRGFTPTSWPGTTINDSTMYVAYNNYVYLIDSNGKEINRITDEDNKAATFFAAPVLYGDGELLVGGYNNNFYNFNLKSGTVNWVYEDNNRFIANPLVTENLIIAPNADGQVYALDADNRGKEVWVFSPNEKVYEDKPIWAAPVLDGETLYIASMDGFIYAVDLQTGALQWKAELDNAMVNSPALSEDGTLYAGTFGSQVIALDSKDGSEIWRVDIEGWVWGSPVLDGDTLYVTDLNGSLYALSAADGSQLWQVGGEGAATGSALVDEDTIYYVTDAGEFYAVSKEGSIRWSRTLDQTNLYGTPVVFGGLIVIKSANADTILYAYDTNGQSQWEFTPAK
jgi:outer membrane protein assembly factor BamB